MSPYKNPVAEYRGADKKEVRVAGDPSGYRNERISWRIRLMEKEGKWGWGELNRDDAWRIVHDRMKSFESLPWKEIENERHSHLIEVRQIVREAQRRLEELKLTWIDSLYSLHIGGKARAWGYRDGATLSLIWWDPNHEIYPVAKKHT